MSESMVERVARAVAEEINGGKFDDETWYNDAQREMHRRRVRATIAAMREPVDDMTMAATSKGYSDDHLDCKLIWQAMIDAALSEQSTG